VSSYAPPFEGRIVRVALTTIVTLHALIHIAGFLKWWQLASLPEMTGSTLIRLSPSGGKAFGMLWFMAFVVLLAAAVAIARRDSWRLLGLSGALLSQALIVVAWPDAKFGSIGNLVIVAALIVSAAARRSGQTADGGVGFASPLPPR
jgi:hypothetical protein